jgi:3D (Asp-Asp-Asp) domain-containing protein
MIGSKWKTDRRYLRRFRVLAIIAGFAFTVHIAHRECARMGDLSVQKENLPGSGTATASTATRTEDFEATAYCVTGITKSGAKVVPGHVAADPKVIPLGSMIYVDSPFMGMGGIYQVLDTGELVKGKIIDIFIPSYERCVEFGRRGVKVQVLRYGFFGHAPEVSLKK